METYKCPKCEVHSDRYLSTVTVFSKLNHYDNFKNDFNPYQPPHCILTELHKSWKLCGFGHLLTSMASF